MSRRGALAFCKQERRGRRAQQCGTRWGKLPKKGLQLKETWIQQTTPLHAQQGNQGFTRADTSVTEQGGKSFEMGVEKLEPRVRRKVRTLRPDIALARNLKERSNAQE